MLIRKQTGFTIVELLIVIVVIGILAAITIVAYNGIQQRAQKTTLISDVSNGAKLLRVDQSVNNGYPTTLAAANNGQGIKVSPGTTLRYSFDNTASPQTFCLSAVNSSYAYMITESTTVSEGSCVNLALGATAPSSYLTDGITTSNPYYSMAVGLQSVTVNLGSPQDVSMVKVWHYYADSRTYFATRTEVSADGTNWQTIFDSASSGTYQETAAGKTHSFTMRKVQYIRDWINGSTSNTGNHWVEIQAF